MSDPRSGEATRLAAEVRAGRSLVLVGPAGIGKTTLARMIASELEPDHDVTTVRGCRSALDVPLGAYEALLPPGVQRARDAIAHLRDRMTASRRGHALFVDDAHDLDDASAFVTLALASTPSLVLICCRRDDVALPTAIDSLERDEIVAAVDVAPLGESDVDALAANQLGGALAPTTATRLREVSGGNPLFVRELISAGLRTGTLAEEAGYWHWVGPWSSTVRLVGLVEEHFDTLAANARDTLELVALAEPVSLSDLQLAIGSQAALLHELEDLEVAQLVQIAPESGVVRVAHPLYGEVLRQALPQVRRHRHALTLAKLPTHARAELMVRSVRWRIEAGLEVSARELLDAARTAHDFEDFTTTIAMTRRAIAAGERVRGGRLLGVALEETGATDEADAALAQAAADATEEDDIVLVGLARVEFLIAHRDDPDAAGAVLDELEARVPAARETFEGERALHLCLQGRPAEALTIARPLLEHGSAEVLARVGVPAVLAMSVHGWSSEAVALAARASTARAELIDGDSFARSALFSVAHAFALVENGQNHAAIEISTAGHALSQSAGATRGEAWFALVRASGELAAGRLGAASTWYEEAAVRFTILRSPAARWAWAGASVATAFRGESERAATFLKRGDDFGPTCWRFLDPLVTRARAWQVAAAGDLARAETLLEQGIADATASELFALAAVLAEDLTRLGCAAAALMHLDALASLVDNPRLPAWTAHARALAAEDPAALVAAADVLLTVDAVAEAADAYAQSAALHWEQGDIAAATAAAAAARVEVMGAQGADTPAVRALAARPPLTERQIEVAALAAEGLPSRDIASRLVLSVRTVDNHLARTFRAFDISTRTELGEVLDAWRPDARLTARRVVAT